MKIDGASCKIFYPDSDRLFLTASLYIRVEDPDHSENPDPTWKINPDSDRLFLTANLYNRVVGPDPTFCCYRLTCNHRKNGQG